MKVPTQMLINKKICDKNQKAGPLNAPLQPSNAKK